MEDDKTRVASEAEEHYIALPSGYRLGKYELQAVLGQGGFGITYRAWDRELDRPVAIKEYLPSDMAVRVDGSTIKPRSRVEDEGFAWGLTRFLDEARALARFEDVPAIVRVYDYMQANGTAYMVMALIDGTPLSAIYRREPPLDEARLKGIILPLLQGLERVHGMGFLHRDIKPANILIRRDGMPVLIDFGAARQAVGEKSRSVTSVFTPGYAPFEQYMSSGKQGPWTDIYALAATLYHGINGKPPPQATDRIREDDMVPAVEVGAGNYSPEFLAAIDAGLAVFETSRPHNVAQWRAMLLGEQPPSAFGAPNSQGSPYGAAPPGPISRGGPASQPSQASAGGPARSAAGPASQPSRGSQAGPPSQPSLAQTSVPSQSPDSVAYPPSQIGAGQIAPAAKRSGLWLGLAAVFVVALGGGGYAAWSSLQTDRQSIETRLKSQEDARQKAEDDAKVKAAELAELRLREEERQKAAAAIVAQQKAVEDAKRQADEDAKRRAEEEIKRKADEELRRKAEADKARADAEKARADADAKKKADEEARKKAEADKAKADADRKAEADRAKAEADRIKAEAAKAKAEADKAKADADAKKKAEEDARKKVEDEKRKADEAAKAAAAAKLNPPAPAPAANAAAPQPVAPPAPQVATAAPGFAYAGRYRITIDCPNVPIPPFQQHPALIQGPSFTTVFGRDGKGTGTISGTTMTYDMTFTSNRTGANFSGTFKLSAGDGGFSGGGTVKGFDQGFPERSCPIKVQKQGG
jgi:serine/threonine protein kinase